MFDRIALNHLNNSHQAICDELQLQRMHDKNQFDRLTLQRIRAELH